jgi:LacI family transcriptional regulator
MASRGGTPAGRPTVKDVAERAGVSTATVSFVLSGKGGVSAQKAQRVRDAAKELGYQGNKAARALRTGSTHSIVVIVPDITNPFYGEVVRGIDAVAQAAGVDVLLCNANNDVERERQYLIRFARSDVEGIIYSPTSVTTAQDPEIRQAIKAGPPLIIVDEPLPDIGNAVVGVDNEDGARQVARHFAEIGCTTPAVINGPRDMPTSTARANAFIDEAAKLGMPVDNRFAFAPIRNRDGLTDGIGMLRQNPGVDCLFAGDDLLAALLMSELSRLGRNVPEELAICGFDNIDWAQLLRPTLTSIHQPKMDLGSKACELLLAPSNLRSGFQEEIFPVSLIVRDSTAGFRGRSHLTRGV